MSKLHELKIWSDNFNNVCKGVMSFQIRKDDRGFKNEDFLVLREYNQDKKSYTGRQLPCKINHLLTEHHGMQKGYVLLNIEAKDVLIYKGIKYVRKY